MLLLQMLHVYTSGIFENIARCPETMRNGNPFDLRSKLVNARIDDDQLNEYIFLQIISGLIQSLLINYGLRYSTTIGSAFEGSLTTSSACFLTSAVLLACYIISEKSYRLIKSSLFVRLKSCCCL